ncbi:MAG: DHHA1 domain-containing protein [Nitrososphaeria archaeon]
MINVIISHSADLDGISSAALLIRKSISSDTPYLLYFRDYKDNDRVYPENITNIKEVKVFIADISTNLNSIDLIIERIKKTDGNVEWTDHHVTKEEIMKKLEGINVSLLVEKDAGSASVLVQKRYDLEDEISKLIADAGFQSDTLNIKDQYVMDLVDIIDYFNYLEKDPPRCRLAFLAVQLALKGPKEVVTEDLKNVLEYYRNKKREELEYTAKSVRFFNINGYRFAIAYATSLISGTQAANKIIENNDADVYIIVKDEGGMSFRRKKNSNINLVPLANIFGGGGHEYASGANLGKKVKPDEFEKVSKEIYEKIKENWLSPSSI